jgi:peptide methionine sulfoxide reductase msrA/msrB
LNIKKLEKWMSKIKDRSLTPHQLNIIRDKATEPPNAGEYNTYHQMGTYLCRSCGRALFRADAKFSSGCGWPSFDANIPHAVISQLDTDGIRSEILCAYCHAHLGHVFEGEGFTPKNKRYCVNSVSLDFVTNTQVLDTEEAIVAGGCFWGIQYYLKRVPGVLKTEVGYTGGTLQSPSYADVCTGATGHFEAVRVVYSPDHLAYEDLLKYFFEIHDPSQQNGQGPDHGSQYRSAIFYYDAQQKQIAQGLIFKLESQGYAVVTKLLPIDVFWRAETSHQHYYEKTHQTPHCHRYTKRF